VLAFVVRRMLWAVVLLFAMSVVTFLIFFVVPADDTQVGRGPGAVDYSLREELGIESESLPTEYAEFLWGLLSHGTLGQSYFSGREVTDILGDAIPVTGSLVAGGVVVFLLLAFSIGTVSALRPRSAFDRAGMVFVLVGISAHPAWIGLVLSYTLGVSLGITPIAGYCDFFDPSIGCGGPVQWAYHLLLPWFTFALLFAALYTRMIRASILEGLDEDYVRTARAKGAPAWLVVRSHVLRNALLPVVTMLGMDVGLAFGGTVFVEQVFGLPGIGRTAVQALARRDLPVIMGIVLFVSLVVVVFNLIVDLVYGWLDPRISARGAVRQPAGAVVTPGRSQPLGSTRATASS
jgi:peptide/nickel transport system permease protein